MKDVITVEGKEYISVRRAAEMTKYSKDYIGQLCRSGKIVAVMPGRNWWIDEASLISHKKTSDEALRAYAKNLAPIAASAIPPLESEVPDISMPLPLAASSAQPLSGFANANLYPPIKWTFAYENDDRPLIPDLRKPVSAGRDASQPRSNGGVRKTLSSLAPRTYAKQFAVAALIIGFTAGSAFAAFNPPAFLRSAVSASAQATAQVSSGSMQTASALGAWWSATSAQVALTIRDWLGLDGSAPAYVAATSTELATSNSDSSANANPSDAAIPQTPALPVASAPIPASEPVAAQPTYIYEPAPAAVSTTIYSTDPTSGARIDQLQGELDDFKAFQARQTDTIYESFGRSLGSIGSSGSSGGSGGGSGSVTSIDASGGTTGLSFLGGPVISAGTLTLSGVLDAANGGTGTSTYAAGDLLYGNSIGGLSALHAGTNGLVLKLAGGVPTWAADLTGNGGGAGAWATTSDNLALYPANTSNVVIIGSNATTSTGNILEVVGNSKFGGTTQTSALTASTFSLGSLNGLLFGTNGAVSSVATSSLGLPQFSDLANYLTSASAASTYLTQTNAASTYVSQTALNGQDKGFFFSTTSALAFLSLNQGAAFSTSSALAFLSLSQGSAFSTTSALYFLSQNSSGVGFSTTSADAYINASSTIAHAAGGLAGNLIQWNGTRWVSAATSTLGLPQFSDLAAYLTSASAATTYLSQSNFNALDKGFFFSTTSAQNFLAQNQGAAFSTSSALAFLSLNQGASFSTTSALYFLAQNPSSSFSTTSADYWKTQRDLFSTTSASAFLALNQGSAFSTSSANAFIDASSTIAHAAGGLAGNLIQWDGTKWVSVATSTLGLGGSGGGSVTSVDANGGTTGLSFTGGPITTSGVLNLTGILNVANGGTGVGSAPSFGQLLVGNSGGGYTKTATSSLGLPQFSDLANYLTTALAASTYLTQTNAASTYLSQASFNALDKGFFFSTTSAQNFLNLNQGAAFSTSSALAFLNVNQGSAFSTTSADAYINASSTIAHAAGGLAGNLIQWNGTRWVSAATSTLGLPQFSDLAAYLTSASAATTYLSQSNFNGIDKGFFFSTTSAQNFLAQNQGAAFSTSSASNFLAQNIGNSFSTTSANAFIDASSTIAHAAGGLAGNLIQWDGTKWVSVATSTLGLPQFSDLANYLTSALAATTYLTQTNFNALDKGFFFSTTSAQNFLAQNQGAAFSTSSALAFLSLNQGASFSTTSALYFLAQNPSSSFSTTSADYWKTQRDLFSTTSASAFLALNQGSAFSTSSANAFIDASSTIAHAAGGLAGNLIQWDGTKWVSVATSTLGLGGSGGGSVTSVDANGGTTGLSFTGGPITTSGVLTLSGLLNVADGGTGLSALKAGFIPFGNGVSALATSSALFFDSANGRLGIGTTTPWRTLSVNGNSDLGTNALAGSFTATSLIASVFPYASTTALTASSLYATTLCLSGDCRTAWPSGGGGSYPFALANNATSTLTQFNGGLTGFASSTIGDGTQIGGLTINGGATTTGNAYFAGNVSIGTPSSANLFQISSSTTGSSILSVGTDSSVVVNGNLSDTGSFSASPTGDKISLRGTSSNIGSDLTQPTLSLLQNNLSFSGTATISGNLISASRVSSAFSGSTLLITGALANFTDTACSNSGSTCTSSADGVDISEQDTNNTGTALNITTAGTGYALRVNDDGTLTDSTPFVIDSNGSVGVGTTTPGSLLSVGNTNGINFRTATSSFSTTGGIDLTSGCFAIKGVCVTGGGGGSGIIDSGTINRLSYYSGATTLDSANFLALNTGSGLFGIGTTTPWRTLSVSGSSDLGVNALAGSFTATSTTATSTFAGDVTIGDSSLASAFTVDYTGNVGIGTSTPFSLLSLQGTSTGSVPLFAVATTTGAGNSFQIDHNGLLTMNTPGATSTINGNLYVNGTLRGTNVYSGDLIFANNFRFTEADPNATSTPSGQNGLYLKNQNMGNLLSVDEKGNLTVTGDICSNGSQCYGSSISSLAATVQALASSSAQTSGTVQSALSNQNSASLSLSQLTINLNTATQALSGLSSQVSLLASSTADLRLALDFATSTLASTTADSLATSTSFIQAIASAVQDLIQSAGDWAVSKISATLAVFTHVQTQSIETETAAVTQGLQMTDQATGQIYCVTIRNGDFARTLGACSTATSTQPMITNPITAQAPVITPATSVFGTAASTSPASSAPAASSTAPSIAAAAPVLMGTTTNGVPSAPAPAAGQASTSPVTAAPDLSTNTAPPSAPASPPETTAVSATPASPAPSPIAPAPSPAMITASPPDTAAAQPSPVAAPSDPAPAHDTQTTTQ